MANQTLDTFVRDALNRGEQRDRIASALVSAGWTQKEVDAALDDYATTDLGMAVPKPRPASVHCYDIDLSKTAPAAEPSHEGHMDVFE